MYKNVRYWILMRQLISATEARERFADLINRVMYRGEEFIVEKQGKPAALITQLTDEKTKKYTGADFLLELTKHKFKGPNDLAKNLDKYVWE